MRKIAIWVLLAALVLIPRSGAFALEWEFGNQLYFTIDRVCRDGAAIRAGYFTNGIDTGDPGAVSVTLAARRSNGTPLGPFDLVNDTYGSLITPNTVIPMIYQPTNPLAADINNDGIIDNTNDTVFFTYGSGELHWNNQPVGASIIIYEPNVVNTILPIENCYLVASNAPSIPAFVTVTQHADSVYVGTESILNYTINIHNWGDGAASNATIRLPFDPALVTILDATFDSDTAWVSDLQTDNLTIQTGSINAGVTVHATLHFWVQPSALDHDVGTRASFEWSDAVHGGSGRSNDALVWVRANPQNTMLHPLSVSPMTAGAATLRSVSGDVFMPYERVSLWYNTPSGAAFGLGSVQADENGAINYIFNPSGLPNANYSLVAEGQWSELTGLGWIEVR